MFISAPFSPDLLNPWFYSMTSYTYTTKHLRLQAVKVDISAPFEDGDAANPFLSRRYLHLAQYEL